MSSFSPALPSSIPDPLLGQVLDARYRIERRIGKGGMGQVYEAVQLKLDRRVAVKVLHLDFSTDEDLRVRFEREAIALAKINHEHVLHAYDHGMLEDGRLYLVTELLGGSPLDKLIDAHPGRRLPLTPAVIILRQLATALEAVHGFLVHRDLKPQNVFVVPNSTGVKSKLLDFGIVRPTKGSDLTEGGVVGTPAYMSPEQIQQEPTIDARSDLYSLGVLAFELVTGRLPFQATRQIHLLTAHLLEEPPRLDEVLGPEPVPIELVELVSQLLRKEPDERPQTASEVRSRLAGIEDRLSGPHTLSIDVDVQTPFQQSVPQPTGTSNWSDDPLRPPPRSRTWMLVGLFAALVGFGGWGFWQALGQESPTARPDASPVHPKTRPPLKAESPEPPPTESPRAAGLSKPSRGAEPPRVQRAPVRKRASASRRKRSIEVSAPAKTGFAIVSARTLTGTQPIIEVLSKGQVRGRGARVKVELSPGRHVLRIRRADGRGSAKRTVRVKAGQEVLAKVLLD